MSRPQRAFVPGQPVHVTQRGNNRIATFRTPLDFETFKAILAVALRRTRCTLHAYALMPNHVHLLATPADATALPRLMQSVGCAYVRYFNGTYQRTGTLWEGRYRASLITSDYYYFACSRYIELNPVRADIASVPGAYRWSSFHHNVAGESDPLVTPHALYQALGKNVSACRAAYGAMFPAGIEGDLLATIRRGVLDGSALVMEQVA